MHIPILFYCFLQCYPYSIFKISDVFFYLLRANNKEFLTIVLYNLQVMDEADKIKSTAQALARLDVSSSLGVVANERVCKTTLGHII